MFVVVKLRRCSTSMDYFLPSRDPAVGTPRHVKDNPRLAIHRGWTLEKGWMGMGYKVLGPH